MLRLVRDAAAPWKMRSTTDGLCLIMSMCWIASFPGAWAQPNTLPVADWSGQQAATQRVLELVARSHGATSVAMMAQMNEQSTAASLRATTPPGFTGTTRPDGEKGTMARCGGRRAARALSGNVGNAL